MRVAGEQHVDAGFLDRIQRKLLPADRALDLLADRYRIERVMRDQHAHCLWIRSRKGLADELDLVLADPAVLEGQRSRGIDAQDGNAAKLDEGTQSFVD